VILDYLNISGFGWKALVFLSLSSNIPLSV